MAIKMQSKSFSKKQRILISVNVIVMIAIAGAIFLGVCHLASLPSFRTRLDLTLESEFSLSKLTLNRLGNLEKDVQAISVFSMPVGMDIQGMKMVEKMVGDYTNQLLKEYEIHSGGRLKVEILDRHGDNLRVSDLQNNLGLGDGNVVIFLCGKNRIDLYPSDLASIDAGGMDPTTSVYNRAKIKSYKAETSLTWALESVVEEKKPKAYFTSGRREQDTTSLDDEGVERSAQMLKFANFEVSDLKLYENPIIPEDCTVLVILGPKDKFSNEEMAAVRSYLQNGGRLFLAMSPEASNNMTEILEEFNISFDKSILCKERMSFQGEASYNSLLATAEYNKQSRISRSIAEADCFSQFLKAGSVTANLSDADIERLVWVDMCWADNHAPGEDGNFFFDSDSEKIKTYDVGLSCSGSGLYKDAKLVFFTDTYFYTNRGLRIPGNQLLVMNSMNWLAARENLLEIPSKTPYVSVVDLKMDEYHEIGFYTVIVIPSLALILGLIVWWLRRR